MSIGIPKHVRIGPYTYDVKLEDKPFLDQRNDSALCGEADHNAGLIRVMRATPERMYVTLWHEVLHGIDDMAGTDLTEDTINRLAPILVSVLLDNGFIKKESKP